MVGDGGIAGQPLGRSLVVKTGRGPAKGAQGACDDTPPDTPPAPTTPRAAASVAMNPAAPAGGLCRPPYSLWCGVIACSRNKGRENLAVQCVAAQRRSASSLL